MSLSTSKQIYVCRFNQQEANMKRNSRKYAPHYFIIVPSAIYHKYPIMILNYWIYNPSLIS